MDSKADLIARTYRGKPWTDEQEAAARAHYDWYAKHFGKESWDRAHPFAHVEARDWVVNRAASGLSIHHDQPEPTSRAHPAAATA